MAQSAPPLNAARNPKPMAAQAEPPRLVTAFAAKQYLGGGKPEALGVERVPGMRRLLYDRTAIDAALDWLKRRLGLGRCPHCGGDLAAAVPQKDALDGGAKRAHPNGLASSPLSRAEQGKRWLNNGAS